MLWCIFAKKRRWQTLSSWQHGCWHWRFIYFVSLLSLIMSTKWCLSGWHLSWLINNQYDTLFLLDSLWQKQRKGVSRRSEGRSRTRSLLRNLVERRRSMSKNSRKKCNSWTRELSNSRLKTRLSCPHRLHLHLRFNIIYPMFPWNKSILILKHNVDNN